MNTKNKPIVFGVAGGTGSGKTTVANAILTRVGAGATAFLPHDAYYRELAHLAPEERQKFNFDHPESLETELLVEHINTLLDWKPVPVPVYDFSTHTRTKQTRCVEPSPIILIEGILIFAERELRELMDIRVFVDTDADVRFIRRLQRDVNERGRSVDSIIHQYMSTVRPMHLEFVEPSKRYADVIVPEGGFNEVAMTMISARLKELLTE
ncbi:MAG: uridine kinase [Chloroflexota bacterium]